MKVFCILNGFLIALNVRNSQRWLCMSLYKFSHQMTDFDALMLLLMVFFKFILLLFSASYISWRVAGRPEDSIPTVPWAASCHTILVPHGCKCIWMALVWCKSCANLWTGSSKPSIWTASNGTSSNLWCHLDPQCTQLPVQCLTECSTFCKPTSTWCHHGCVCSESH